jgi:hypothetical protein
VCAHPIKGFNKCKCKKAAPQEPGQDKAISGLPVCKSDGQQSEARTETQSLTETPAPSKPGSITDREVWEKTKEDLAEHFNIHIHESDTERDRNTKRGEKMEGIPTKEMEQDAIEEDYQEQKKCPKCNGELGYNRDDEGKRIGEFCMKCDYKEGDA